jgi:hypothetical protein
MDTLYSKQLNGICFGLSGQIIVWSLNKEISDKIKRRFREGGYKWPYVLMKYDEKVVLSEVMCFLVLQLL